MLCILFSQLCYILGKIKEFNLKIEDSNNKLEDYQLESLKKICSEGSSVDETAVNTLIKLLDWPKGQLIVIKFNLINIKVKKIEKCMMLLFRCFVSNFGCYKISCAK